MYSKKFAIGTINLLRKCNFSLYIWQKSGETIKVKTYNVSFGIFAYFCQENWHLLIYITENNNAYNLQNTKILHTILVLFWYHFESNTTV